MSVQLAERVRHDVLDPVMDAQVLNREQAAALARLDTPEVDSMAERIRTLRDVPVPRHSGVFLVREQLVDALESDLWKVVESNDRESRLERQAAGAAEGTSAALYSTAGRISLDPGALAKRLRPVLHTLAAQLDPKRPNPPERERALAWIAWGAIARQVPVETLLTRSLAHELRRGPTATLHRLVAELQEGSRSS